MAHWLLLLRCYVIMLRQELLLGLAVELGCLMLRQDVFHLFDEGADFEIDDFGVGLSFDLLAYLLDGLVQQSYQRNEVAFIKHL